MTAFAKVQLYQAHLYLQAALPKGGAPEMPPALFRACHEVHLSFHVAFIMPEPQAKRSGHQLTSIKYPVL